jgi:threonine dehydratase
MRRLGAELHLAGIDFEMAKRSARRHAAAAGLRFVEDGAEPAIAEGAGTIGVELAAGAELDSVVVPIGDGALLAGVGVALRHLAPTVRIVGVVAKGASAMQLSLAAGRPVATERADTIADGLACREPVAEAVAMLEGGYDEVRGVADADIVRAMAVAVDCLGIVLEPAGAAGIAAILADPAEFARQRTGIIVSGSNATLEQLSGWMASCSAARCQAGPP